MSYEKPHTTHASKVFANVRDNEDVLKLLESYNGAVLALNKSYPLHPGNFAARNDAFNLLTKQFEKNAEAIGVDLSALLGKGRG